MKAIGNSQGNKRSLRSRLRRYGVTGVCYDSRRVKSGDLFVAVRGYESDGHKYIPMAVEKGCAAVLCEEAPAGNVPYVQTDDSRLGLALAARNFYGDPSREMKVIGITGTNGKTTTTILIKQILEKTLGAKVGLIGSISNMIGDEEFHAEHTTPESCDLQALFRQMTDARVHPLRDGGFLSLAGAAPRGGRAILPSASSRI